MSGPCVLCASKGCEHEAGGAHCQGKNLHALFGSVSDLELVDGLD